MKPIISVENVDYQGDQIEVGTLVVNKARVGIVTNWCGKDKENKVTAWYVFNLKLNEIETWLTDDIKIFKGKLIMEQ